MHTATPHPLAGADSTCRLDEVKAGERVRIADGHDVVEILVTAVRPTIERCVAIDGAWRYVGARRSGRLAVLVVGPRGLVAPRERTAYVMPKGA